MPHRHMFERRLLHIRIKRLMERLDKLKARIDRKYWEKLDFCRAELIEILMAHPIRKYTKSSKKKTGELPKYLGERKTAVRPSN